jgi:hypothetical protein
MIDEEDPRPSRASPDLQQAPARADVERFCKFLGLCRRRVTDDASVYPVDVSLHCKVRL